MNMFITFGMLMKLILFMFLHVSTISMINYNFWHFGKLIINIL